MFADCLTADHLVLRRPAAGDADALGEAVVASLPELAAEFRWAQVHQRFERGADASAHLLDRIYGWEDRVTFSWFVWDGDQIVGEVCIKTGNRAQGALDYFIWTRSDAHRRGYATEASHAVFEHLFAKPDVELVEARVAPRNAASRRLLSGLGFEPYGTLDDYDRMVLFPLPWARSFYARRERILLARLGA